LIDNDADSARQGDRKVRAGSQDGLARNGQAHELRIPAGARRAAAACRAGVGFHGRRGHQATQHVHVRERGLRLTTGAAPRRGTTESVSRGDARNVDARQRCAQAPAA